MVGKNEGALDEAVCSRRYFVKLAAGGLAGAVLFGSQSPQQAYASTARQTIPRSFVTTDSLGRSVVLPVQSGKVAPSGSCAQILLSTLCPEKIASLAVEIDQDEAPMYRASSMSCLLDLPVTGEAYSCTARDAGSTTRMPSASSARHDVLVDAGFTKYDLGDRLDELEAQTDSTAVFVDVVHSGLPSAYRMLGSLLGCERRAERLASYIECVQSDVGSACLSASASPRVLFAGGSLGRSDRNGDLIRQVIALAGGTPVEPVLDEEGLIDLEALSANSVDVVVFNDRACFESLENYFGEAYETWRDALGFAVVDRYVVTPTLLYRCIGSVLTTQTIGAMWLANLLHPGECNFDLREAAQEFYELFFGYELSEEQLGWFDLDEGGVNG